MLSASRKNLVIAERWTQSALCWSYPRHLILTLDLTKNWLLYKNGNLSQVLFIIDDKKHFQNKITESTVGLRLDSNIQPSIYFLSLLILLLRVAGGAGASPSCLTGKVGYKSPVHCRANTERQTTIYFHTHKQFELLVNLLWCVSLSVGGSQSTWMEDLRRQRVYMQTSQTSRCGATVHFRIYNEIRYCCILKTSVLKKSMKMMTMIMVR